MGIISSWQIMKATEMNERRKGTQIWHHCDVYPRQETKRGLKNMTDLFIRAGSTFVLLQVLVQSTRPETGNCKTTDKPTISRWHIQVP